MESAIPQRTVGLKVIAVLALVQSAAGVLRALRWFDTGSDLLGQGLLLLPMVGLLAIFRGALVAGIALMYVLFAYGALLGRSWARWLGIVVAAVSLLLFVSVMFQGESLVRALVWAIVPVAMLGYLFSSSGSDAFKSDSERK